MEFWPRWSEQKVFSTLLFLFLLALIVFFGFRSVNEYKSGQQIGRSDVPTKQITVEGQARLKLDPDLATINAGLVTEAATVALAQEENSKKMNALLEGIKGLGVSEKDIQTTSYTSYENQEWNSSTQRYDKKGWVVNQNVEIHLRELEKSSELLALLGQNGATNINGPQFSIEDPNKYREEARQIAVDNAKQNAEKLKQTLGVKFGDVIGYNEYVGGGVVYPMYNDMMLSQGVGGAKAEAAPSIEQGTEELIFNVSVTYELR